MDDPAQEDAPEQWCILRTSPGRTLPLARSLADAGFRAWTPMEVQDKRRPRSNAIEQVDTAIAPTFVFAHASHLPDLAMIARRGSTLHPPFSLFRFAGRVPLLDEADIEPLRTVEGRRRMDRMKKRQHVVEVGKIVRLTAGAYEGMTGIVESSNKKEAWVRFGGGRAAKVASWLLESDVVDEAVNQGRQDRRQARPAVAG